MTFVRHYGTSTGSSNWKNLVSLVRGLSVVVQQVLATSEIEIAVGVILDSLGEDVHRDGLIDTPRRVAKMYSEYLNGYQIDPKSLFTTFEGDGYNELVIVKDIPFFSMCEHHMLPFHGTAHVGYIPTERIVGISKIARLVEAFGHRLQVQERMTAQIADTMVEHLKPRGVMVVVEAEHLCMSARGIQKPGSKTVTSVVRGDFHNDPEARAEFLSLVKGS